MTRWNITLLAAAIAALVGCGAETSSSGSGIETPNGPGAGPVGSAGAANTRAPAVEVDEQGGAVDIAAGMGMHGGASVAEPAPRERSGATWSRYFADATSGAHLTLAAGDRVALDVCDVDIASIAIEGTLVIDETLTALCPEATFRTDALLVTGQKAALLVGREEHPYDARLTVTLGGDHTGPRRRMAEQRMLMVERGARVEAFGASAAKRSWTSLDGTVRAGTDTIRTAIDTGWEAGDVIVIASSSVDPREAETRRVVATDGRTHTLDAPLAFDHFGRTLRYGGKTIDTRAEVGLLSHDIVIEGDATSVSTGIGGTIMIMNESMARPENDGRSLPVPSHAGEPSRVSLSGVELRRLGQRGRPGRYALHWHLVGDGAGQYVRDSAVHHGFQRAVNVHGTNDVTVERVVGYDVANHMFVPSEEGDETGNVFRDNLGILTRAVSGEHFAFPTDKKNDSGQSEQRASTFWLRNTFNVIEGNRAAGVLGGQGFFLDPKGFAGLHNRIAYEASGEPELCRFRDNLAHSLYTPLGSPDLYSPAVKGFGIFMRNGGSKVERHPDGDTYSHCTFSGFQAYKAQLGGVWIERNTTLENAIVTDSHTGVVAGDVLRDIVVVGQSENALAGGGAPRGELDRIAAAGHAHPDRTRGGFVQSDNGGQGIGGRVFHDLVCINLPACFTAQANKAGEIAQYRDATVERVTLVGTPQGFVTRLGSPSFENGVPSGFGTFTDVDGALTGTRGTTGSMRTSPFLDGTVPMDNRFGWEWDPVAVAPSD